MTDLLRAGAGVRFTATGHCMAPLIRSGDVLIVEPLRRPDPPIGAVLACEVEGRLIVHRLVHRAGGRLLVRGDLAAACDPPLAPTAVLGVVTGVERRGRGARFGLGRGRLLLAWLSRLGLLRAGATLVELLRRAVAKRRGDGRSRCQTG